MRGGKRREGTLGFVELGPCAPLLAPNLHSGILVYSDFLGEPALAGSPRKASLPSIERQKISITINKDVVQKFNLLRCIWARIICSTVCGEVYRFWK